MLASWRGASKFTITILLHFKWLSIMWHYTVNPVTLYCLWRDLTLSIAWHYTVHGVTLHCPCRDNTLSMPWPYTVHAVTIHCSWHDRRYHGATENAWTMTPIRHIDRTYDQYWWRILVLICGSSWWTLTQIHTPTSNQEGESHLLVPIFLIFVINDSTDEKSIPNVPNVFCSDDNISTCFFLNFQAPSNNWAQVCFKTHSFHLKA